MINIESMIKEQAVLLKSSRRNIDIAPDIPEELIKKWEKKYSDKIDSDLGQYILALSYTKTGNFALTGDAMYYDNYLQGGMKILKYTDIASISSTTGRVFSLDKVTVKLKDGNELYLDGCVDGINVTGFAQILSVIVKYAKENELTVSKQSMPLYDISDDLKLLYLKILCNYAYIDNQMIDASEYNAISSFSIRMEISSESRKKLREYMNSIDQREKTGYLLKDAKTKVGTEFGQWDAFRYSLLQDVLYIHNIQDSNKLWSEDGFVGSLMQSCGLHPAQMDTMVKAVSLNQRMQEKDADLKKLKKEWKTFIAKIRYTDGYVPTLYLFCAGSIYGISNYTSFIKKDDTSQKAINKQRELILHEIIENNQKTLNVLIDDMNYLAERLEGAINEGAQLKEDYKNLLERVKVAMSSLRASNVTKEEQMRDVKKQQEYEQEG